MERNNFLTNDELLKKLNELLIADDELKQTEEKEFFLKENQKKLSDFLGKSSSSIITFVGAGLTKSLGIQTWKDLLESLKGFANIDKDIPDSSEWPEYAEDIYYKMKGENKETEYFKYLINKMTPNITTTNITLIKLILLFKIILTTNFDNGIKNACKFVSLIKERLNADIDILYSEKYLTEFFKSDIDDSNNTQILYLHRKKFLNGNYDFVLKKSDYEKYYTRSDAELPKLFEKYYLKQDKHLLFLGFSFSDRFIRETLEKIKKKYQKKIEDKKTFFQISELDKFQNSICHYWITDISTFDMMTKRLQSDVQADYKYKKMIKYFHDLNIYPILYKENQHIFVEYILDFFFNKQFAPGDYYV